MTAQQIVILAVVVLVCYYPAKWILLAFRCAWCTIKRACFGDDQW